MSAVVGYILLRLLYIIKLLLSVAAVGKYHNVINQSSQ